MTPEERKARKAETSRLWRLAHPERVAEIDRKSHEKRREQNRIDAREHYRKHPEKKKAAQTKYRETHRDTINAKQRIVKLLTKYGMTPEDRDTMLTWQGGVCAICGTDNPGRNGWQIDHCHNSNTVRGILCLGCNISLGLMDDNVDNLKKMIQYLERHRQ